VAWAWLVPQGGGKARPHQPRLLTAAWARAGAGKKSPGLARAV